eukprot:SAG22_NODE_63_length_23302_cov_17.506551_19_plen_247_part_00
MQLEVALLLVGPAQLHAPYDPGGRPQYTMHSDLDAGWRRFHQVENVTTTAVDDEVRSASSGTAPRQLYPLKMDEDPRSVGGGTVMVHSGYVDQPYCVVNDRMGGEIQCTATVGPAHEGGQGEHVSSLWSHDGTNWSQLVRVEPSPLSSSYSNIFLSRFGRLYTIYNFNEENIRRCRVGCALSARAQPAPQLVMTCSGSSCCATATLVAGRGLKNGRFPNQRSSIDMQSALLGHRPLSLCMLLEMLC